MVAVQNVQHLVDEWTAKGKKAFGMIRKMLSAKSANDGFADGAEMLRDALQALQMCLSVRIFGKVDKLLKLDFNSLGAEASRATNEDLAALPNAIKQMMSADAEFKAEMNANFDDVKQFMGSEVSESVCE
jgi:hypothetical protein